MTIIVIIYDTSYRDHTTVAYTHYSNKSNKQSVPSHYARTDYSDNSGHSDSHSTLPTCTMINSTSTTDSTVATSDTVDHTLLPTSTTMASSSNTATTQRSSDSENLESLDMSNDRTLWGVQLSSTTQRSSPTTTGTYLRTPLVGILRKSTRYSRRYTQPK